jgi:hypothetical protein
LTLCRCFAKCQNILFPSQPIASRKNIVRRQLPVTGSRLHKCFLSTDFLMYSNYQKLVCVHGTRSSQYRNNFVVF